MLALVQPPPRPPPPTSSTLPPDIYTRTMSLAVLPSSPVAAYTNPHHEFPTPSPSKRPKLSLDTSSVAPTAFGKKATSLRLETLSATSPTVRNTFSNAHEQKGSRRRLTPITTRFSTSPESAAPPHIDPATPFESTRSISSSGSTSSTSSADSTPREAPYKLPFNHASILKNGPIDRRSIQMTSFAHSKPMFPPAKKVGFKAPLTEEITTAKFTLRHSDIESSSSTISTLDLNESAEERDERVVREEKGEKKKSKEGKGATSPQTGEKRESSNDEEDDGDGETYPTTPVAGRRKRHRQWRWTLGPVRSTDASTSDETPTPGRDASPTEGGTKDS